MHSPRREIDMNFDLKFALIRQFGSQVKATKVLDIDESRLSRLVQGHLEPTAEERARFAARLGCDYFAPDGNGLRNEEARAS
jgi:hypothetical protein